MEESYYAIGDVVALNSELVQDDSVYMTVIGTIQGENSQSVKCRWFEDGDLIEAEFPIMTVKRIVSVGEIMKDFDDKIDEET